MLDIKILGMGCPNCIKLENLVNEVVTVHNIPAKVEKITDRDIFMDYGIMMTPGLVVNGKVLAMGKVPVKSTLEHWLKNMNGNTKS